MSGAGRPLLAAPLVVNGASNEGGSDVGGGSNNNNSDGNGGGGRGDRGRGSGSSSTNVGSGHESGKSTPVGRQKRTLIESACSACRKRKSRCDGARPICSRCQNLRTECQYEAEEGESRWSALRRRNQILEAERDQLRELLGFVQSRPEPEAQEIFQHIRQTNYDDLLLLLRHLRDGYGGSGGGGIPSSHALGTLPAVGDQRLPPIQTILDVPRHAIVPPPLTQSHSLSSDDSRASRGSITELTSSHRRGPPSQVSLPLDTLEPSLNRQRPVLVPSLSLSSEESISSASIGHEQRPMRSPP